MVLAPPGLYWVLDTDYDNYASVYSCVDVGDQLKFEYGWVLTRDAFASDEIVQRSFDAFINIGVNISSFEVSGQSEDCQYAPEGESCADGPVRLY